MDYYKLYDDLIDKYGVWEKPKDLYSERHRKVPGWIGGKYVKGNAFYLSARTHFIAHLILAKIYDTSPAWKAVVMMSGGPGGKRNSWWYSRARESCFESWSKRGKEWASEYAKKHGILAYQLGIGCHARSFEKMSADGKKGGTSRMKLPDALGLPSKAGKAAADKGAGCHNPVSRMKGVETQMKKGIGIHGQTSEDHIRLGKLAASVKFRCLECGMVSSAGVIGKHQKCRNHTGRERV